MALRTLLPILEWGPRYDRSELRSDLAAGLLGVQYSSVAWGDYDNDGDLDILLTGEDASVTAISRVYQNGGVLVNTPPDTPGGLVADVALGCQRLMDAEALILDYAKAGSPTVNGLRQAQDACSRRFAEIPEEVRRQLKRSGLTASLSPPVPGARGPAGPAPGAPTRGAPSRWRRRAGTAR